MTEDWNVGSDSAHPQDSTEFRPPVKRRGHGAKSEEVRERTIVALLSENSIGAAAERCGLNEKTLRVWMADDEEFKQDLSAARRSVFEVAMGRLQPLAAQAVETLAALMGELAPPSVRLGAARTVAELGIHRDDAETILRKFGEIEALQRQADAEER
jgi:hypothetical protein